MSSNSLDPEKAVSSAASTSPVPETHDVAMVPAKGDEGGFELGISSVVVTTDVDGLHIVLRPAPVRADPLDPLNWPLWRKYTCIAIACYSYFLLTYLTTAPVPSFFLLEDQFNASYEQTNWTFAISAFGLIFGPLLTAGLGETYGRRICLLVSTAVALLASGCTSIRTQNISAYMFERFLQGLGAGSACNLGLSIINDLSFEHERGLRVGLWALSANVGTLLGGVFGGLIVAVNQFWVAYHVTIAFGVLLLLIIFVLPETHYPRKYMLRMEAEGTLASVEGLPRTRTLPYFNLKKIPEVHHAKFWTPWIVVFKLWAYPNIVLSIMAYVFGQYWWIVAITTMEPLAYEEHSPQIQGVLFIGLLVGVLFAEAFCSGHMTDKLVLRLAARNNNKRTPEMRLWLGLPATVISGVGCILWGISVERNWHWAVGQVAFFLYALGLQIGNTVVSAYMVDNYPSSANELSVFYGCIINMSAFLVPWFIADWVERDNYTWTFSVQGIFCFVLVIPAYVILLKFGQRWWKPARFGSIDLS
ncbi:major facilitator superfamily transporter [Niveomyces insectorum RCEF 264]|uniref:Major facilitator superfamily transporter n=1 Tax=Niveomyces insectorum RCEF 264 TaxID=1081102 RepID=A0A167W6D5_9HYPO|nr:major facilitator superfamily transporter [Niveomyces insectorum RCEF 264]